MFVWSTDNLKVWDSGRLISNLQFELLLYKDKSLRRKLAVVLTLS